MNPKVARSVCTWRNRDQWNAMLWCSAHPTDQVTVISETLLEADECGRAPRAQPHPITNVTKHFL